MSTNREIVRNAYLTILEREPDEEGLNHYTRAFDNGSMNTAKLHAEMQHSYENSGRILCRIYRDLFNREPDQAGSNTYIPLLHDGKTTENQLREDLKKSHEYVIVLVKQYYKKIFGADKDIEQKDLDRYVPLIRNNIINFENLERIFVIRKKLVNL